MRTCPKCKKLLELMTYAEKEIFQCLQCRGFWFTNDLFREVKQVGFAGLCAAQTPEDGVDTDQGDAHQSDAARISEAQDTPELICPDCDGQALVAYNYAYSSDIQLHRCALCKGIWADRTALLDIEQLLVNYQESLEDAKSKALPLMMEVKRQFKEQEEAWEAERRKQRKQGLLGKFFRKKSKEERKPMDIFEDIHHDNNQDQEE